MYVGSSRPASDSTPAPSQSVPKPAGTLDSHHATLWAISDDTAATITWPTGFVESSVTPLDTGVLDAQRFRVATKICSGEPASWTVTSGSNIKAGSIVHSGRDTITPIHRISGRADTTARGSPWTATSNAFSSATTIDGCDLIFLQGDDCTPNAQVTHGTPPSGFTLREEHTGATDFQQGAVWSKDNVAAGDTGVYSSVSSETGGSTNLAVVVIALAPAAAPIAPRQPTMAIQQRAA
jgi:hypothetical protein